MLIRTAQAEWKGNLLDGFGKIKLGSGVFEGSYSFSSRFADGTGTNPDELLGAAHAGCFSMAFSADLSTAGFIPKSINTKAHVHIEKAEGGFKISTIQLHTVCDVPGIDNDSFQRIANSAKTNCPVSKALAGVDISLEAKLI